MFWNPEWIVFLKANGTISLGYGMDHNSFGQDDFVMQNASFFAMDRENKTANIPVQCLGLAEQESLERSGRSRQMWGRLCIMNK